MRLFIAIGMPDTIKEYLASIQKKIDDHSNKIKPVSKDQMHLTLKFLGEVQPNKSDEIKRALRAISFEPFSASLSGIGVFPDEDYIRVVWVGLEPEEKVLKLQKEVDDALKHLFNKEKNFKAHITLARVKFINNKKDFIDKLKKIEIEDKKVDINSFKLVKSTLMPNGPVYEDLEVFGETGFN